MRRNNFITANSRKSVKLLVTPIGAGVSVTRLVIVGDIFDSYSRNILCSFGKVILGPSS